MCVTTNLANGLPQRVTPGRTQVEHIESASLPKSGHLTDMPSQPLGARSDQSAASKQKGRPAAALLSGSDQFVRSRGGIPLGFVDSEALRRSEHPGEVLRPVNVDGSGGHPGGPGGMLRILQFRWQRANKLVIRSFR